MNNALKVFILEDMKNDQELLKRQVLKFNPNTIITIAADKASFYEKMSWLVPDIVLSDFSLPDFTGLDALLYIKENHPLMPFVFVTGELNNEEKVADAIIRGADGYLLKKNLRELPALLTRVMENCVDKIKKKDNLEKEDQNRKLLISKIYNLLTGAPSFEGKSNLETLVKNLEHKLNESVRQA